MHMSNEKPVAPIYRFRSFAWIFVIHLALSIVAGCVMTMIGLGCMDDGCPNQPDHSILISAEAVALIMAFPIGTVRQFLPGDWSIYDAVLLPANSATAALLIWCILRHIHEVRSSEDDAANQQ
jgi:hypothetical protein